MKKIKSYAFDWDDNLLYMPTQIFLLKSGKEIGVSTNQFAEIRTNIGLNGYTFLPNGASFRDFQEGGDHKLKSHAFEAELGPSWIHLTQCINKANICAIITARANSREVFYETIKEMIYSNYAGIDRNSVTEHMKEFEYLARQNGYISNITHNMDSLISQYLDLLKIYPVSHPVISKELGVQGQVSSPEQAKEQALCAFIKYINTQVKKIITPDFCPKILVGFSDDDKKNIQYLNESFTQGLLSIDYGVEKYIFDTSSGKVEKRKY